MKRLIVVLLFITIILGGCGGNSHAGRYVNPYDGYIELKADGKFDSVSNGEFLEGDYTIEGNTILLMPRGYETIEGTIENDTINFGDEIDNWVKE